MEEILIYLNSEERLKLIQKINENSSKGKHQRGSDQRIRLLKNDIIQFTYFLDKDISLAERLYVLRNNFDIFYKIEINKNNIKYLIELFLLNCASYLNSPLFRNKYIKKFLIPVIIEYTCFLPENAMWYDRWYCIKNNIDKEDKLVKCNYCGKYIKINLSNNKIYCTLKCWTCSEELKQSSSITSKGRKPSKEKIQNQIKTRKQTANERGYYFTEETKHKISNKAKGNKNFLINGKPWNHKDNLTDETRIKWEKSIEKQKKTKELKGYKLPEDLYENYKKYNKKVYYFTKKQSLDLLDNYEKRGKSGIEGTYQLDHKYSIVQGFKDNIEPFIIGNIVNLHFIPSNENSGKGKKCIISKEKLYEEYSKQIGKDLSEIFTNNP